MSSAPSGAARKASTRICRESKIKGQCSLVVTVKETTQGSSEKEYSYKVNRVKITKPEVAMKDEKEVVYKYTTKVKAL